MMKMKYCRPRFLVKVSQLRLELGCFEAKESAADENKALQITGIATSKGLLPFLGTLNSRSTHTTSPKRLCNSKAQTITWDSRDLYGFDLLLKHGSISGTYQLALHVLYGEGDVGEYKPEMGVVGKVSMRITMAELMMGKEMKIVSNSYRVQRTLPIQLKVHGLHMETTISVTLSLMKLGNFHDDMPGTFLNKVKYLTSLGEKINGEVEQVEQPNPYESDNSVVFDSDDSSDESTTTTSSGRCSTTTSHCTESRDTNESERFMGSDTETRLDTVQRIWSLLSWNRSFKEWNFKTITTRKRKQKNLNFHSSHCMKSDEVPTPSYFDHKNWVASSWENKEIWSRDGQAKVKTNVFFASFDQRSKQASGEGACAAIVVFIAHWLHSNLDMPTIAQFDSLITQGSSEWRRLCYNNHYLELFPDKHFDLEAILETNIRPLVVVSQKSYTGFFSPEKFNCLKGAMSFDEIWDEITRNNVVDYEPRIYIISWNDHFFVLKVEIDAYYIIDSLGERLFEGCQQAFILKFDDSSLMHARREKAKEDPSKGSEENERLEIVCSGKDCGKEFIKRFLAAIPLRQLEEDEENKGTVSNPYFHRQLQIDFHFSLFSS